MADSRFPIVILPFDDAELRRRIETELARHGWQLAAEPVLVGTNDTFNERVKRRLFEWCNGQRRLPDDALVRRAIVHEYCYLLHAAVGGDDGRLQSRAVDETIAYGWPLALKHCQDREVAESAILGAVHKTWLTIERCLPGSYLAYYAKILLNEINQERRGQKPVGDHETTEAELLDPQSDESDSPLLSVADPSAQLAYDLMLKWESLDALLKVLSDCLKNVRQEHIILLHFFAGFNPSEIAGQLRIKVNQYYVEKSRALSKIRKCCLEDVARELRVAPGF